MPEEEEDIEVTVRQIHNEEGQEDAQKEYPPFVDLLRRVLLAGVGAVAMTHDEAERMIDRMVERGEIARKDGEKILNEVKERFRQRPQQMQQQVSSFGERIESSMEQLLNNLNIPTRRDIDELSSRVSQLAERLDELRRQRQ